MKKVLFSLMCACVALFAVSCEEDEVAKKYQVTVTVSAEGQALSSLSNLQVTAAKDNGEAISLTVDTVLNTYSFKVVAGSYKVSASAQNDNFNFIGETPVVVVDKDVEATLVMKATPKKESGIIFKEIYYTGVMRYYFMDAFYELVNNSDKVQYLDGLVMCCVDRGYSDNYKWEQDSLGTLPPYYPTSGYVMMFPGSGKDYPLEPGQTVVVANQAMDHSARELTDADTQSPSNLADADFELFIPTSEKGVDNENVPNMIHIAGKGGYYFMPAVAGQPMMLFRFPEGVADSVYIADTLNYHSPVGSTSLSLCVTPDMIVDAVDMQRQGESRIVKVFAATEDAGYTYVTGTDENDAEYATDFDSWTSPMYCGKSIRRKCTMVTAEGRAYFMDTNNSSNDFILGGQKAVVRRKFTTAD